MILIVVAYNKQKRKDMKILKTNEDLQRDVQNAIKWEPLLSAAEIGVTAKDGVIRLTGIVDSYSKKIEAESAAKKVGGVKAVVEEITIKFADSWDQSDADIAKEALIALKLNYMIPVDKVKVENARITLYGDLSWDYQRKAAKNAVNHLRGVEGVTNDIKITSEIHSEIEKNDIESALACNWSLRNHNIKVEVSGHKIKLSGTVQALYQRDEAEKIAWNTPGAWAVDNEVFVDYPENY